MVFTCYRLLLLCAVTAVAEDDYLEHLIEAVGESSAVAVTNLFGGSIGG